MTDTDIKAMSAELASLREQVRVQACQIEMLTTALEHSDSMLKAADTKVVELEAALTISMTTGKLTADSRFNVAQLLREAA